MDAIFVNETGMYQVNDSPRAGGAYFIPLDVVDSEVIRMTDLQKVQLTTWLIGQKLRGDPQPMITKQVIDSIKDKPALPVHERAHRLLHFIARRIETVGSTLAFGSEDLAAYAWSESTGWGEIVYCFDYLLAEGLVRGDNTSRVSVRRHVVSRKYD